MSSMRRLSVVLTGLALVAAACGDDGGGDGAGSDALRAIEGVVVEPTSEATHVEGDLDYPKSPPSGGAHNPAWQNCGFYTEPVFEENAVHSLEHGAVWLAYPADLDDGGVGVVNDLVNDGDGRVVAAPHPDVTSGIVAVAWEHRLEVADVDDPRLAAFVATAIPGDHAPEPGASCQGAIGDPV